MDKRIAYRLVALNNFVNTLMDSHSIFLFVIEKKNVDLHLFDKVSERGTVPESNPCLN